VALPRPSRNAREALGAKFSPAEAELESRSAGAVASGRRTAKMGVTAHFR